MSLTPEQVDALLAPLDPRRVRTLSGNAHLEAWDIRRHLLRVFGWGGWSEELLTLDCVSERSVWDEKQPLKGRHTVVYRCTMRLIVKDADGTVLAFWDDGASGDAANQPSLGDAHDFAMKTAISQALKRCAVNLGDRFGLSLYAKGGTAAVVGGSIAHKKTTTQETAEHVDSGEMDQSGEAPPAADRGASAPQDDVWQTSDPVAVDEWKAVLEAASDKDALTAAWADLNALCSTGQVTTPDRIGLVDLWNARKLEVLGADGAAA